MTDEEKAQKIKEIYQNSLSEIKRLREKALFLLKGIKTKREEKKIQDLSIKLKE